MSSAPAPVQEILSFLRTLDLSKAAELARRGRLIEAESLISGLAADPRCTGAATDLLARIRVQQGRFFEAQKLWMDLAQLNPTDGQSRKALVALEKLIGWGRWYGISRMVAVLTFGFILAAGMTVATRSYSRKIRSSTTEEVHAGASRAKSGDSASQERPPDLGLNIAGALVRAGDSETDVRFESSLFTEGTTFRPNAAKMIEHLARQLGPNRKGIEVIIEGYTDNLPVTRGSRFRDNVDLGNARAQAVSRYLIRFGGLLPSHIFLQSDLSSPYPNDSFEGGIRNRTVALRFRKVPR